MSQHDKTTIRRITLEILLSKVESEVSQTKLLKFVQTLRHECDNKFLTKALHCQLTKPQESLAKESLANIWLEPQQNVRHAKAKSKGPKI